MTLAKTGLLGAGFVLTAVFSVGCCDKEKNDLAAMTKQYNEVNSQNKDLRDQLSQANARQSELLADLDRKGAALAELQKQNKGKVESATEKAGPVAPGDWEKGLNADRVTLGTDILFPSGQAKLTPAGTAALDKIAATLKTTYSGLPVRVYGYTDTDPIHKTKNLWQDNLDLSANRAMAVTRLLRSKGISAEAIETVAMGETHPIASNSSTPGKTKNRRVEIVVIKTK